MNKQANPSVSAYSARIVDSIVADAIAAERFLILPHPEVQEYMIRKATDPDRWLGGMRKLQARIIG